MKFCREFGKVEGNDSQEGEWREWIEKWMYWREEIDVGNEYMYFRVKVTIMKCLNVGLSDKYRVLGQFSRQSYAMLFRFEIMGVRRGLMNS